jgi:Flp pilus assembly pilin Flp
MVTDTLLRALALMHAYLTPEQEDGQTVAEYALMITVVAVATIVLATIAFRGSIANLFNYVSGCFDGVC